ncbi:hypothetical protein Cgig2_031209 [Carnegiea gigantea]|uniref:Squalene cyclase C-terminal domain-containing protein n=1 Tax=Carnegiea gigantea TaxID=171969 RepID=A0A9Q1KN50_9CARY|nr:hypothetical protein Cgig2_031209 [Carnegiea gigantea]
MAFLDQDHGWQVSDCTAGGLKCCLMLSTMPLEVVGEKMDPERLYDSVNILLSLQSQNGGLSAWEPAGAPSWLELLNPIEFFADIVIEHQYAECTGSAVQALILFNKLYPEHRKKEIATFMEKATKFLEDTQYPNGGWCIPYNNPLLYKTSQLQFVSFTDYSLGLIVQIKVILKPPSVE